MKPDFQQARCAGGANLAAGAASRVARGAPADAAPSGGTMAPTLDHLAVRDVHQEEEGAHGGAHDCTARHTVGRSPRCWLGGHPVVWGWCGLGTREWPAGCAGELPFLSPPAEPNHCAWLLDTHGACCAAALTRNQHLKRDFQPAHSQPLQKKQGVGGGRSRQHTRPQRHCAARQQQQRDGGANHLQTSKSRGRV